MEENSYSSGITGLLMAGGGSYATRKLLGQQLTMGAFYSIGAEPLLANVGFGAVFSDQNFESLSKQARYGMTNIQAQTGATSGNFLQRMLSSPVNFTSKLSGDLHTASGTNLVKGGVITSSKASALLPLAMSGIGLGLTMADEGASGVPGYLVRDFLANHYAMKSSILGGDILDTKKLEKHLGMSTDALNGMKSMQTGKSILKMPMASRMLSITAGHVGAMAGASLGQSLTEAGASYLSNSYFDINKDVAGMFGYIFGAAGGAAVGSAIGASGISLGIAALGLMAGAEVVSRTYSHIEGGFAKAQKARGLNFAGDTAAYFTQNAVTMRERALQAMNKSHMNARSAFGQEANIVHMNRDMFSQYKRY
jgi:hypothetical protein